jgi:ABC-type transport system substrate-binding protein
VTAHDFAYTWRTMREERVMTAHLLEPIAEAVALDERTLELRLMEPSEYLPYLLAIPPAFPWPRHRCEALGADWRTSENLVSNGPFVLAEDAEGLYRFEASATWALPRGNVRTVELTSSDSVDVSAERWLAGEFDLHRSGRVSQAAIGDPNSVVTSTAGLETGFVAFNGDRPPFDELLVRKAFVHATDSHRFGIPSFIEAAHGGGLVPPPMPAHSHRAGLPYDPGLARALLADAGFPAAHGLPELTLTARSLAQGEDLAKQWREALGAQVRVVAIGPGFGARIDANAYQDGWVADYPNPLNFLNDIRGGLTTLPRDERVSGLLEQARAVRDRRARIRLLNEAETAWISERAALVPLTYSRQFVVRRPWVHGYWLSATVGAPFEQVDIVGRPEAGAPVV